MKMTEKLKGADRTLLEMHTGMLCFGLICQIVGSFFASDQGLYAGSLWFGIAFAMVGSIHMARTLDRALACGDGAAKVITRGYVFRYIMIIVIMGIIAVTKVLNVLVVFLGYMSLKVTAYLQPITHKLCNRLFLEEDPEAEPLTEDPLSEETVAQEGENPIKY